MTEEKLLKCPNCNCPRLTIITQYRTGKRHYFVVWCVNCNWSQKFASEISGLEYDGWTRNLLKGHKPLRKYDKDGKKI